MTTAIYASDASTSQPPCASWQHIYGIIRAEDTLYFDVADVEGQTGTVCAIPHGGLAAVVSPTEQTDYRHMARQEVVRALLAHQHVVEAVMRDYPVLPVKFGTVLPGEEWVARLLAQGESLFRATLAQLAGRVQMEIIVSWDLGTVFQEIGGEPEIVQLKERVAGLPPAATLAERVAIGQLVRAALDCRAAELRAQLLPSLRSLAVDTIINATMDDSMVANVGLLLDAAGQRELPGRLDELDARFGGRLRFRCVGPLPPYSFATAEIQLPVFAEIEAARQLLGLAETATRGDIKRAYRRLASQFHPDQNAADPDAESRMQALTRAYNLLIAYAASQNRQQTDAFQEISCDFSRAAVEQTLLISIRALSREA